AERALLRPVFGVEEYVAVGVVAVEVDAVDIVLNTAGRTGDALLVAVGVIVRARNRRPQARPTVRSANREVAGAARDIVGKANRAGRVVRPYALGANEIAGIVRDGEIENLQCRVDAAVREHQRVAASGGDRGADFDVTNRRPAAALHP